MIAEGLVLSAQDRASPLWARLEKHFAQRLTEARAQNDSPELSEAKTAALRGEIRVWKGLIELGAEPPKFE